MRIAIGQLAVSADWRENLDACAQLMEDAERAGARLLVLPEASHARFNSPPSVEQFKDADQPINGPFVNGLLNASKGTDLVTVVGTCGSPEGFRTNTLAVLCDGEIRCTYDKLHLMDALGGRESDMTRASMNPPVVFDLDGHKVGLMTCYDVRFPELARLLALSGAELIALPAAWVAGPQKERHWNLLVATRALENTCYVAASGECGPRNVGSSMLVDPMGVVRSQLGHEPGLLIDEVDFEYLQSVRKRLPVLEHLRFRIDPTVQPVPRDYEAEPMPDLERLVELGRVTSSPS